jgi:putative FmdB family regulatory protein
MEVIQGINENPLGTCPKCGGKLEKLISNSSFVLKGSGWYKTDYSGSNPENASKKTKTENAAAPAPACSCANGTCGHN